MKVQLFATCLVDTFFPHTGEATVRLLRHFGVDVAFPHGQTCCGKPADSGGYTRESREAAKHFISVFMRTDGPIVIPSGSCASMVKNHYPELFKDDDRLREQSLAIAARVYELSQFLVHILKVHQAWPSREGTHYLSCFLSAHARTGGSRRTSYASPIARRSRICAASQCRPLLRLWRNFHGKAA